MFNEKENKRKQINQEIKTKRKKKDNVNIKKKIAKQTNIIHIKKLPIFMLIGLTILVLAVIGIYYLFLNFKERAVLNYEGYAISGKKITETLLGNNSEEKNNEKTLFLTKISEQDKLYKKLNDYFVGENKKEEINLNYPIYINDNTALYNLSQEMKLITSDFEELSGYPNLTVSNGIVYNESDLERVDEKEYIFLKNESNIFTNLKEIKIQTVANEYTIPVNSNIYFDKGEIRYYEIKKDTLRYREIKDIDEQTKVSIGKEEVNYEELLTKLKLKQIENQIPTKEKEIIEEDTSKENEKKQEENKKDEPQPEQPVKPEENAEELKPGAYIKPEVTCTNFKAKVYTASTNLTIKDPSGRILEPVTFTFRKDGRIYLRKIYTSSGNMEVKGLLPNTTYEIEGSFIYENEAGQKVENTFYKDIITTTGFENLDPITLSFENGEIFSNKIQLKNLKITSDLQNEAIKGIKRLQIETRDIIFKLTGENLKKFIKGEAIEYETAEGIKSNQKVNYTIKLYDNQGNELKVENNTGETRTSKQKPSVKIRLNKQNVIEVEIGLDVNNRDKIELENYRYQITRANGEIVKEVGLKESDRKIHLNDLDPNQYYTIRVYASYDLGDSRGKQENQVLGETIFTSQPLSTLGYLEVNAKLTEIQPNLATIEVGINEDRTDKRLIQILDEIKIELVEEGTTIETITITGEELKEIKIGKIKTQVFEDLISNMKYKLNITSKVKQGETIEEVQVTYSLKEFVTLKNPTKVEMRNLFVTGNMIDFDVRIEDTNHAVLTNQVRMELRDAETNLIVLEEINTNEDYIRKTIEKLEEGETYTLSFYADQYNEGDTDSSYRPNYLLKELKIVAESGISGSIGLADLSRKATGKNLVDMSSNIKWYVYPVVNTGDYYGKEYNKETKILTLGGHGNNRRAVYDLREYAGKEVTMSFKAKLIEGEKGNSPVYTQNSKNNVNTNRIQGLTTKEWKEHQVTLKVDKTGYLGFWINGGNGVEIKELQIELGDKKTKYEEFQSVLQSNMLIELEDKRNEISNNNYFVKTYQDGKLIEENEYQEFTEESNKIETQKSYLVESDHTYKFDLVVKIKEREYVLDSKTIETKGEKEIKGIRTIEDWYEIQPNGEYVVLNDIDLSGRKDHWGGADLPFKGKIDFNGQTLTRDATGTNPVIYINEGTIENLVFNIKLNNKIEMSYFRGFVDQNKGVIENVQINLIESTMVKNENLSLLAKYNYGTINKFVLSFKVPCYGVNSISGVVYVNHGLVSNGYAFGSGLKRPSVGKPSSFISSTITAYNYSTIKNIYNLTTIDVNSRDTLFGLFTASLGGDYDIENVYSVGLGENYNLNYDPNVYVTNSNKIKNSYYINDQIFNTNVSRKTTELALYDTTFQNQVLNSENAFNVNELVKQGYYPQLEMSDCMPNQEYIKLPEVTEEDLPDILSTEVIEQGTISAKVKIRVHNPAGETITQIVVKNVNCDILSQSYENGISDVIVEINNPILCVSNYSILSITTKGAYGLPFTRTFQEKERIMDVELFREIYFNSDWKQINKSPTENYKLMTDLDFSNEGNNICITKTYSGKLDGNEKTIRNIRVSKSLLGVVSGEVCNLNIRNYEMDTGVAGYIGIIGEVNPTGLLRGVNATHVSIGVGTFNGSNNVAIGGLTGLCQGGVQSCGIQQCRITIDSRIGKGVYVGGLVGYAATSPVIENSFVSSLTMVISENSSEGIGGLVGKFTQNGVMENCYATGKIISDSGNIGGTIGRVEGSTFEHCYSDIDIVSSGDNIGGIIGSGPKGLNSQCNLSLGNIYSSKKESSMGRIIGRDLDIEVDYAYTNQRINGYLSEEKLGASELLSYEDLTKEQTYKNKLGWTAYDTSQVEDGILPKLYKKDSTELLPNQNSIELDENLELEISEIETQKIDVNTISIQVTIYNPKQIELIGLKIEDMDYKVDRITNKGKYTFMTITATPTRYYDSYRISEIWYKTGNQELLKEISAKIEVQFFKEIYSYEDWQAIEIGTYQNYRLMNDIDFAGKTDVKTNVTIGRLEAEESKHTLKNLTANFNDVGQGLIQTLQYSMKNIIFENINITNTKDYTGIIPYCNGEIENINFNGITIEGKNYTGCISNVRGNIYGIQMQDVNISGTNYVGGLAGSFEMNNLLFVSSKDITVNGNDHVGGLVGRC